MIEVVDHGLGIPPEQVGKLFQKFARVRTEEHLKISGTGLGLYICRLIVEGHGGQIWVESELGKGSTFGLALPVDARAAQQAARRREADRGAGPAPAPPSAASAPQGAGAASAALQRGRSHARAGVAARSSTGGLRRAPGRAVAVHHVAGVLEHVAGQDRRPRSRPAG